MNLNTGTMKIDTSDRNNWPNWFARAWHKGYPSSETQRAHIREGVEANRILAHRAHEAQAESDRIGRIYIEAFDADYKNSTEETRNRKQEIGNQDWEAILSYRRAYLAYAHTSIPENLS